MMRQRTDKTIAIVGGGVSGALTAYHLMRRHVDARVVVIDPRPEIGLGLAYSTPSLRHLLNVTAGKISALPDQPSHFLYWLKSNYDADATSMTFAPRAIFGKYVKSLLDATSEIEHEQAVVVGYRKLAGVYVLALDNGRELQADLVVLATGNFDPAELPGISESATSSGAYCHNAWAAGTYRQLDPNASVTLIGTGLTSVDVLLRLRELGHSGTITAVSRHAVFPNRHAEYTPACASAIPSDTQTTCVAYVRALRAAIASGVAWRAAIDSLRETTNDLWLALPLAEQKRFRRHLQRRWDVVRHRMAPSIADLIDAERSSGRLILRQGNLHSVETTGTGAIVSIRSEKGIESFETSRVINCTGPSMNYRRVDSPLLQELFKQGSITSGPLGGGLLTTRDGAVIDTAERISDTLFVVGPARLGTLLESIAIPEIRRQAVEVADTLVHRLDGLRAAVHTSDVEAPTEVAVTA